MARLAAFDMDGTLLMPDHRLGEKTLSTLKRLHERDVTLTFATGRHVLEMRHLLGAFSLDAFLITGNGTRIHSVEGDVLHRRDLNPEVADIVLHSTWDTQASVHVFNDDGWFTGSEIPELLHAHVYSGFKYQLTDLRRIPAHATPANRSDTEEFVTVLDEVGARAGESVYADKGYSSQLNRYVLAVRGLSDGIMHKAARNRELTLAERAANRLVSSVRSKVERVFGTLKRGYGFFRARYLGTAKVELEFLLNAVAFNLKKAVLRVAC